MCQYIQFMITNAHITYHCGSDCTAGFHLAQQRSAAHHKANLSWDAWAHHRELRPPHKRKSTPSVAGDYVSSDKVLDCDASMWPKRIVSSGKHVTSQLETLRNFTYKAHAEIARKTWNMLYILRIHSHRHTVTYMQCSARLHCKLLAPSDPQPGMSDIYPDIFSRILFEIFWHWCDIFSDRLFDISSYYGMRHKYCPTMAQPIKNWKLWWPNWCILNHFEHTMMLNKVCLPFSSIFLHLISPKNRSSYNSSPCLVIFFARIQLLAVGG